MIVSAVLAGAARFWSKVRKGDGCWEWSGSRNHRNYGIIFVYQDERRKNHNMAASRFSWILHFGAIPDGMQVCHTCDNPPCVRPDHLWLGTAKQNTDDRIAKGRRNRGHPDHCKHGHPYTPDNTYRYVRRGYAYRQCKRCAIDHCNRRRQATREGQFRKQS